MWPNPQFPVQCITFISIPQILKSTLREKSPNTEFFLVRILENTDQESSVFRHFSRKDSFLRNKEINNLPVKEYLNIIIRKVIGFP